MSTSTLPLLGTDIVHLPRILHLITKQPTFLQRFTSRILTPSEQSDFHHRFNFPPPTSLPPQPKTHSPAANRDKNMARWLAGRFAAKEAARKAWAEGAGNISWKEVTVRVGEMGKPEIDIRGSVGRVSISHDADYVVATVLV